MNTRFIDTVCTALNSMEKKYCELSQIDYRNTRTDSMLRKKMKNQKILERPIAYEFFHQFRNMMDLMDNDLDDNVIQAEVDKRYQIALKYGSCPDFLIHKPNISKKNLAVIEFKLASRTWVSIRQDIRKLHVFLNDHDLEYENAILVIIGLEQRIQEISKKAIGYTNRYRSGVRIIGYNTEIWKSKVIL